MKLLSGNSNRTLSQAIATHLDMPLTKAQVKRFADNEVFAVIEENVRGEDVFIIQSTSYPANDNLMELLIMTDALVRASARRITAVMPYFGYARQDRKPGPRTPISAKLVANLVTTAGADRVLAIDLHAGQFLSIDRFAVSLQRVGVKMIVSSLRAKLRRMRARSSSISGSRLWLRNAATRRSQIFRDASASARFCSATKTSR